MANNIDRVTEINRMIVESSLLFISIFATIGLLIGGQNQQFKTLYYYLGYMLYYSIPFILAAFWGTISIFTYQREEPLSGIILYLPVVFFVSGLATLLLFASSAAQTILLPSQYLLFVGYQSLSFIEFIVAVFYFTIPLLINRNAMSLKKRISHRTTRVVFAVLILTVTILVPVMTIYGVNQSISLNKFGNLSLKGDPDHKVESVDFDAGVSDQVLVLIKSINDQYLSYALLVEAKPGTPLNMTTREGAKTLRADFGKDISFQQIIDDSRKYFLAVKSESSTGTNATYSIQVFKTDTSILIYAFFALVISSSILLGILMSPNVPLTADRLPQSEPEQTEPCCLQNFDE